MATDTSITCWYAPDGRSGDWPQFLVQEAASVELRRSPLSRRMVDRLAIRYSTRLERLLRVGRADIAYSPDFSVPRVRGARRIVTVHDLAWMIAPDYAPANLRAFLDRVVPRQVAEAGRVVVVSNTTRNDVIERLQVDPHKIVLAPNGVDSRFGASSDRSGPTASRLNDIPEQYLLMVGTLEPRKNYLRVIQAMRRLQPEIPLLIAGGRGWQDQPIVDALAEPAIRSSVRYLGYVPDAALPSLYANAAGLVAASVYEGFDLPVLEAISSGTAIAVSDIPVHHEIAGDLATYFDPYDVDSIADGIIGLIERDVSTLLDRDEFSLITDRYRWENSAAEVWRAIRETA